MAAPEARRPPEISRLSFRPDRYDTVLLNGRPLDDFFSGHSGAGEVGPLVFPLGLHDRAEQALVLERLNGLSGWTPILVCPDDLDLNCTVFSAWVEERGGQVVWSRFAFGLDGESDKVEVAPVIFDKREYLSFIREAEDRAVIDSLVVRLCSKPPATVDLAGELSKHRPEVASGLLSRLIFDAGRSRCYASQVPPEAEKKPWPRWVVRLVSPPVFQFLFATMLIGLRLYAGRFETWYAEAILWGMAALYLTDGIRHLVKKNQLSQYEGWEVPVFMTGDGFRVGWNRELIPWAALSGYQPGPEQIGDSAIPPAAVITVEADGRVGFRLKSPGGSGEVDPDLSALNAGLDVLIRTRGQPGGARD